MFVGKKIVIALAVATFSMTVTVGAAAADVDCKKIKNSKKKLECYEVKERNNKSSKLTENQSSTSIKASKDAIDALKHLGIRVETGVSYNEYGPYLGDTSVKVKTFLESEAANEQKEAAASIAKALGYYQEALENWSVALKFQPRHDIVMDTYYVNLIKEKYPEIEQEKYGGIYYPSVLNKIWELAKKSTKEAEEKIK